MSDILATDAAPKQSPLEDCWNSIGVRGNGNCPKLKQHIHCRNCPVYSAAASLLLERELPPAYADEWTSHISQSRALDALDIQSLVVFRIGAEWLGLHTRAVSEFVDTRAIH